MTTDRPVDLELTGAELELSEAELDHVVGGSIKFSPEYTKWAAKAGSSVGASP
ncbi:MAG TPA: hypothetical protein VH678_24990 [Xanthobacteraceae bacterium]|jgi:hypothetical protein